MKKMRRGWEEFMQVSRQDIMAGTHVKKKRKEGREALGIANLQLEHHYLVQSRLDNPNV